MRWHAAGKRHATIVKLLISDAPKRSPFALPVRTLFALRTTSVA